MNSWLSAEPKIHLIFTSAILKDQFDLRRDEYLKSLQKLRSFGIEPWIIEATNISASFFDHVSNQVFYPQQHDYSASNKGINETVSIFATIPFLDFDDEDIVVKCTGRYFFHDSHFFDMIRKTAADYDAWGIYGKNFVSSNHLFTGCFAMRWKYYKQYIETLTQHFTVVADRSSGGIGVEQLSADFIAHHHLRFYQLDSLHLTARVFFGGGHEAKTYTW